MASTPVAEDEDRFRAMIVSVLQNHGYVVSTAADEEEARQTMRTQKFDLIVTDIIVPERDGLELIMAVRTDPCHTPHRSNECGAGVDAALYLKVARKFGAILTLVKPFTVQQIVACCGNGATARDKEFLTSRNRWG